MHYISKFIFHFIFRISSPQDILIFHVMNTHTQPEQTFTLEDLQSAATPTEKKNTHAKHRIIKHTLHSSFLKSVQNQPTYTLYVCWLLKKTKWLFNQSMRGRTLQPTEPAAIQSMCIKPSVILRSSPWTSEQCFQGSQWRTHPDFAFMWRINVFIIYINILKYIY